MSPKSLSYETQVQVSVQGRMVLKKQFVPAGKSVNDLAEEKHTDSVVEEDDVTVADVMRVVKENPKLEQALRYVLSLPPAPTQHMDQDSTVPENAQLASLRHSVKAFQHKVRILRSQLRRAGLEPRV